MSMHAPAHKQMSQAAPEALAPIPEAPPVRDFHFTDHGSIVLLQPLTLAARHWCDKHLPSDCARWAGSYAIEHRYYSDIHAGILDADLNINPLRRQ